MGVGSTGFPNELEARSLADAVIDENHIVRAIAKLLYGALVGVHPDEAVRHGRDALQNVLRQQKVIVIIIHEQDGGCFHRELGHGVSLEAYVLFVAGADQADGNSTISNQ